MIIYGLGSQPKRKKSQLPCPEKPLRVTMRGDEMIGKRFGRWTVLSKGRVSKNYIHHWLCKCDCGTIKEVRGSRLKRGISRSCGCLALEERTFHGYARTDLYWVWQNMINRCKPGGAYYDLGRRVCEEWQEAKNFIEWALKNGYKKGLQIDRKNNDGDYEPSNCHFVTAQENSRNRSTTKLSHGKAYLIREMYKTELYSQREIARALGVSQTTIGKVVRGEQWP